MRRKVLLAALWTGGGLLALFFLLRTFFADVYRVESGSMEPFIHGGDPWAEWVLVRYDGCAGLRRFDLAVVYEGNGKPIVKRVAGLPGENVQVLGGDLFVDGHRLHADAPRPCPVVLFDGAETDLAEEFQFDPTRWSRDGRSWTLDSRDHRKPVAENLMRWRTGFDDGYLLPDGTRVRGSRDVNDGGVELEVQLLEPGGSLRVDLREAGDCFRTVLELEPERTPDGRVEASFALQRLRLLRSEEGPDGPEVVPVEPEVLVERSVVLPAGEPWTLSFSNVDDSLVTVVNGSEALVHEYEGNRAPDGPPVAPGKTLGPQVAFGGEGLHARFRDVRVLRDAYWVSRGSFATDHPISLGPGEYFLLGDNSARSLDGRTWGATPASAILGRPLSVVWPRSRARSLLGTNWLRVPAAGSAH